MAAVSNTLFALLSPGDRVVSVKDTYGGTNKLFVAFLPRFQINVSLCDTTDHEAIEASLGRGCKLLYLETPTNPTIKIVDIKRLAAAAHRQGALVVVDNTFATPINQQPLALGADLVLHSTTKFLGGHADALGGALCGPRELVERVYHFREINGACLEPMSAYLLLRGMKTLHLRVRQQNETALQIAHFLESQPRVLKVFYPGLASHEGHEIARRQMSAFGGMLSFRVRGGRDAALRTTSRLKVFVNATSLGGTESLIEHRASSEGPASPTPQNLLRVSVGLEHPDDLVEDLAQALG
jgi:cystathionine gamma-synthase